MKYYKILFLDLDDLKFYRISDLGTQGSQNTRISEHKEIDLIRYYCYMRPHFLNLFLSPHAIKWAIINLPFIQQDVMIINKLPNCSKL